MSYIDKKSGLIVKIATMNIKESLKAKVESITMNGLVTVLFSEKLVIPKDYMEWNDNFVDVVVIAGEEDQYS